MEGAPRGERLPAGEDLAIGVLPVQVLEECTHPDVHGGRPSAPGPRAPTAEATARRPRCQAPRLESARRLGVEGGHARRRALLLQPLRRGDPPRPVRALRPRAARAPRPAPPAPARRLRVPARRLPGDPARSAGAVERLPDPARLRTP